jgi:hypothetical protein
MRTIRRASAYAQAFNSELLRAIAGSDIEDFARHPNRCFPWHCPAHGRQARVWESISIVGVAVVLGLLSSLLAWPGSGALSARRADLKN